MGSEWTPMGIAEALAHISTLATWFLVVCAGLVAWYFACRFGLPWSRKPSP